MQRLDTNGNGSIDLATEGAALAMAMAGGGGSLQPGERFALSLDVGTYEGKQALSFSSAMRLSDSMSFSAGLGAGLDSGSIGGRAGLRFGW